VWSALPFLRDYDLGAPFDFNKLNGLNDIAQRFLGSSYEFIDPKLEAIWKRIADKNNELLRYLSLNTFRIDTARHLHSFKVDGEYRPDLQGKINTANAMATDLYNELEAFERICQRKLGAFEQVEC
jgi:hypothetical protein